MEAQEFKNALVQRTEEFLTQEDWNYEFEEKYLVFIMGISLQSKLKDSKVFLGARDSGLSATFTISIGTDDAAEDQLLEFVARANDGMTWGNFNLDVDRNCVTFHTFLPCFDMPTNEMIRSLLVVGAMTLDRYGDALLSVIFGLSTAKEAIQRVEG